MQWNFQAPVFLLHPARYKIRQYNYTYALLFHFLHEFMQSIQMHDQSSF